jgi:PAS domain S-box-containing protein
MTAGGQSVGYLTLSKHNIIREANNTVCQMLGLRRESTLKRRLTEFIAPESQGEFDRNRREVLHTGKMQTCELLIRCPDGGSFWASLDCALDPAGLRVTVRDISTLNKTREELSVKDFAITSASAAIALFDLNSNLTYVNPALLTMWGYETAEEVLGKPTSHFITEAGRAEYTFKNALEKGEWQGELEGVRKDGSVFDVYIKANLVRDARGTPVQMMASFLDITEGKRAQEALRLNEERFRTALQSSSISVATQDLALRFTWMYHPELGYSTEDVIGKTDADLLPADVARHLALIKQRVLETGTTEKTEVSIPRDGENLFFDFTISPMHGAHNEITGITNVVVNITEHKRLEDELARQAIVLSTVMDSTGAMLAYFDRDFNFIMANKAYIDACGHPWDELKSKNHFYFFPDAENEAIFTRARDTGEAVTFRDKPFEYADQPWRGVTYWDWTLVPVKDISNRVTGLVLSLIETTAHAKLETRLAYLASFPELSPNSVFELDIDGKIKYLNPAARMLFPELIYQSIAHPLLEDWGQVVDKIQNRNNRLMVRDIEVGQRWYEQTVTYLPTTKTFRIYATDITERKKAEKMKDEFLSLVSHELRTPLTVIGGSLKVAMDNAASPEEARELIQSAAESTDMLADILENMLELSRHQVGRLLIKTEYVEIGQLVNRAINKIRGYGATQEFQVDTPPDLPRVKADPLRIERVLYNLLGNAVKLTDHGRGIPKHDQEGLFKLFNRMGTPDTTPGVGLGLVVCERLLEAHGGWINVESDEGKGSTFSFGLPLNPKV